MVICSGEVPSFLVQRVGVALDVPHPQCTSLVPMSAGVNLLGMLSYSKGSGVTIPQVLVVLFKAVRQGSAHLSHFCHWAIMHRICQITPALFSDAKMSFT